MGLIYYLDIAGTFAFAISGALVATKNKFDLFGVYIIASVTAVGGGMLRDLLINSHPVNWMGDLNYIWTIIIAVVCTLLFKSKIEHLRKSLFLFDTIGISVFTLLGLQKGISLGLPQFIAIVMGMVSAVFGGVLRDVLTNQVPLVFKKEIYASACLLGGLSYIGLANFSISDNLKFIISASIIIIVRTVAVKYQLELPKITKDLFGKKMN